MRVLIVNVMLLLGIFGAFEFALYSMVSSTERNASGAVNRIIGRLYWKSVNLIQYLPECAQFDEELFYTLKPGSCTFENRGFSTEVAVNSAGLRDDEASLDAPQIVVIGDSHAMGWGIEGEETFAARIEAETGLRTLNAAISSYGTAREIKILDRVDVSAMDALVVQFSAENDDGENKSYLSNDRQVLASSEAAYQDEVTDGRKAEYFPFMLTAQAASILFDKLSGDPSPARPSAGRPETSTDRFLDVLADAPAAPLLVMMELSLYGQNNRFAQRVAESPRLPEIEEKFGTVVVLNTRELLGQSDFMFPDGHTNADGHAKIADAVIEALSAEGF